MRAASRIPLVLATCVLLTACTTPPPQRGQDPEPANVESMPDLSEAGMDPRPLEEIEAVSGFDCPLSAVLEQAHDDELVNTTRPPGADTEDHAPYGLPVPTATVDNETLLHHKEYLVNFDSDLRIPVWVSYVLEKKHLVDRPRTNCFRADPRVDDAVEAQLLDYVEPVFDRGHMVPRADMNRSEAVMLNTFVLTNMTPQHDRFNQGIWGELETKTREIVFSKGKAHIVSGAVFDRDGDGQRDADSDADRVQPTGRLAIPTHFYKVILHERENGFIEGIAVLLPHDDVSHPVTFLNQNRVSIDTIEAVAGYDLFPDLPDAVETALESSVTDHEF